MSMYKNLMTFGCAAVLALGLAACGGGGGDDTADAPTTMEPTGPTPAEQIAELQTQINALRAELGLDPVDIDELTSTVAELQAQLATLQQQAEDAKAEEDAAAAEKMRMEMAAAGKALHGALGDTPLGILDRNTNAGGTTLNAAGLTILTADATDTDPVLEAGDAAMALGSWKGMNYAFTTGTGDSKVSNAAVMYNNKDAPTPTAFGTVHSTGYDEPSRTLTLGTEADDNVMGADFPTAAEKTFSANVAGGDEVSVSGTYNGVAGTYFCTIASGAACTARYTDDGIVLGANWVFRPSEGREGARC